jgi:hypothetical protein
MPHHAAFYIQGPVAEWLGTGLQNLLQRFESARDLEEKEADLSASFFFFIPPYDSKEIATFFFCRVGLGRF